MLKKEKTEIRYHTMRDIIDSLQVSLDCGIREKAFDWAEIGVRGLKNKRRILNTCKRYGKVKCHLHGFSIRFIYV